MDEIYVVCEGQSEQSFVKRVLGPFALTRGRYLHAPLLGEVGHKGGFVEWRRVRSDLERLLKQRASTQITTLIDLYGIGQTMRALASGPFLSAAAHATAIEDAVADAFGRTPRLVPYIQVHEFEALLFTDLDAFERATGHVDAASKLAAGGLAPEEINGTYPPSKRILEIYDDYDKVNDGTLASQAIGIPAMRVACPRFDGWLDRLGL